MAVPIGLLMISPLSSFAQQMNFAASLTGKDIVQPVSTLATGTASFHINPDGSLRYAVNASKITGVLGAHIEAKNGTASRVQNYFYNSRCSVSFYTWKSYDILP